MKIGIINIFVSSALAAGAAVSAALGMGAPVTISLAALAAVGSTVAGIACGASARRAEASLRGNAPSEAPQAHEASADQRITEPLIMPEALPGPIDAEAAKAAEEAGSRLAMARLQLRYADSILSKVPIETEAAAFALMERIITIRNQSEKARNSAIASNSETTTNDTVAQLAEHAQKTISGVRSALANMRKHDKSAAAELQALGKEITAGVSQLAEIGEITERSRLIAFNMAIEAARIGSKGNGFKVIVNELRDLNDQIGRASCRERV